jgi:hypothetical protein
MTPIPIPGWKDSTDLSSRPAYKYPLAAVGIIVPLMEEG